MEDIYFEIDWPAVLMLGILVIGIVVLISTDFLRIYIRAGKPRRYYPRKCYTCGEHYDGNHHCPRR